MALVDLFPDSLAGLPDVGENPDVFSLGFDAEGTGLHRIMVFQKSMNIQGPKRNRLPGDEKFHIARAAVFGKHLPGFSGHPNVDGKPFAQYLDTPCMVGMLVRKKYRPYLRRIQPSAFHPEQQLFCRNTRINQHSFLPVADVVAVPVAP